MSYARRPMGDYKTYGYAGDPGFLSSLWRGVKKIAPTIIGGMIGGPVGALIGSGAGSVGQPRLPPPPGTAGFPAIPGTVGGAITFPGGTGISLGYAGQGGVVTRGRGSSVLGGMVPGAGGVCPTGYHLAKDGSGRMVRNRRMNIANPRALRRAMRRVQGFEKMAKRTIQFTRRVKMKKRSSS